MLKGMASNDKTDRREELARAVWKVARADGAEALSVRRVADVAGCSIGTVQYYFPTKLALLQHAFELSSDRTLERIFRAIEAHPDDSLAGLRRCLKSLLPITPESAAESEVWFGFMGLALSEGRLRRIARLAHSRVVEELTSLVRSAQIEGQIHTDYQPDIVITELLALTDGLCFQEIYHGPGRITPNRMCKIIEDRVSTFSYPGPQREQMANSSS